MTESDSYITRSTSSQSCKVEMKVLSEGPMSRLVLQPEIVRNDEKSKPKLKFTFYRQKKSKSNQWENEPNPHAHLKVGEISHLSLDSEQTEKFLEHTDNLRNVVGQKGFQFGEKKVVTVPTGKDVIVDETEKIGIVKNAISKNPIEIWKQIISSNESLANFLAGTRVLERKKSALAEFGKNIGQNKNENYWQDFFERNQWIFGLGLELRFLKKIQAQPYYGGTGITGRGAQEGDFLLASTGQSAKYTVTVEIKTPETLLLKNSKYRNGAWPPSDDLAGGISQIQSNTIQWEVEGSRLDANQHLRQEAIYSVRPKGILVIGHTRQLNSPEKAKAFESCRRHLVLPEIITFDELLDRAQGIVGTESSVLEENQNYKNDNDDVPF